MKNISKISIWFGASIIWSILFISLASYSAQKALEADPDVEEKLGQHFSEKWGTNINVSFSSDFSRGEKEEWVFKNTMQKIDIKTINGDIEITTVPDSESIKIKATGQLNKSKSASLLEVSESKDLIQIQQPDKRRILNLRIIIEIPASYIGELNAGTVSGDISANSFKPQKMIFKTVSGDISIADIQSQNIQVKTISGDLNFNNVLSLELEAKTTSGDVSIQFPVLQNDINYDIKTVSGDVNNQSKSVGQIARQYKVSTISGDVEIR